MPHANLNLTAIHHLANRLEVFTVKFNDLVVKKSEDWPKSPHFKEMFSPCWLQTYSGSHTVVFLRTDIKKRMHNHTHTCITTTNNDVSTSTVL